MKKLLILLIVFLSLSVIGCSPNKDNVLEGMYQSEASNAEYVIQMTFQPEDNSFVQYIENREVDKGTYKKIEDNSYELKSDKQNFEIELTKDNSFKVTINQLNNTEPFILNNIGKTPAYITTDFNDIEEYEKLLDTN